MHVHALSCLFEVVGETTRVMGKVVLAFCWVTDCRAGGFGQKIALWLLSFDAGL